MTFADLAGLSALVAIGHVLYGLPRTQAGTPRRITLHNGDDFAPTDEPPRPERLASARLVTTDGWRAVAVHGARESGVWVEVSGDSGPGWLVVETTPAFIALEAESFERYLVHEGLDAVRAIRAAADTPGMPGREVYTKFAKTFAGTLSGPSPIFATPVGLPLEIVPTAGVVAGSTLEARLLRNGQPVGGQQVRVHHRPSEESAPRETACVRTGADGLVRIPVDAPGVWRLHTIAMAASGSVEADWQSQWASLTFGL